MNSRRAGPSVHIGVNNVDPGKYTFHVPPLRGCLNDANSMRNLAVQRGYTPTLLTESAATAANVQAALSEAVSRLTPDQTMLVTYAGHGSQVADTNSDESDQLDETWVLYDRQLIDDELAAIWGPAPAGSRILVVSDSCHSGTATRAGFPEPPTYRLRGFTSATLHYGDVLKAATDAVQRERLVPPAAGVMTVWPTLKEKVVGAAAEELEDQWAEIAGLDISRKSRMLDPFLAERDLIERQDLYRPFLSLAAGGAPTKASVLLLSACSDRQTALDGRQNGLFTQELLGVLQSGGYRSYPPFIQEIARRVNLPDHNPSLFWSTAPDAVFESSEPFAP